MFVCACMTNVHYFDEALLDVLSLNTNVKSDERSINRVLCAMALPKVE